MATKAEIRAAVEAEICAFLRTSMDNPPRAIPPDIVSATRIIVTAFTNAIERGDYRFVEIERLKLGPQ